MDYPVGPKPYDKCPQRRLTEKTGGKGHRQRGAETAVTRPQAREASHQGPQACTAALHPALPVPHVARERLRIEQAAW